MPAAFFVNTHLDLFFSSLSSKVSFLMIYMYMVRTCELVETTSSYYLFTGEILGLFLGGANGGTPFTPVSTFLLPSCNVGSSCCSDDVSAVAGGDDRCL